MLFYLGIVCTLFCSKTQNLQGLAITYMCSLVPRPIFANITAGEKYSLVLIVYGCVSCDCKFNSKTCSKTIVKFNENKDK